MAPRFAIVPARWLGADSGLTNSDRLTLCILCIWVNRETEQCWPSVASIAAHAALSENTVRTALRRLVAFGALTIERRPSKEGDSDTNLYTVLGYDPPPKPAKAVVQPLQGGTATIEVPVPQPLNHGTSTEAFEVPQPLHPNVVKDNKEVDVPAPPPSALDGPSSSRVTLHDAVPNVPVDWRLALASAGVPERHLTKEGKFS